MIREFVGFGRRGIEGFLFLDGLLEYEIPECRAQNIYLSGYIAGLDSTFGPSLLTTILYF